MRFPRPNQLDDKTIHLAIFNQCSKGESDPLLPIVILLTRVGTSVMELPNHLASHLESKVGIEPTFADLQSAAKTTIGNSPIKMWKVGLVTHNLFLDRIVFAEDYFHKWQGRCESNTCLQFWRLRYYHCMTPLLKLVGLARLELANLFVRSEVQ